MITHSLTDMSSDEPQVLQAKLAYLSHMRGVEIAILEWMNANPKPFGMEAIARQEYRIAAITAVGERLMS